MEISIKYTNDVRYKVEIRKRKLRNLNIHLKVRITLSLTG